MNFIAGILLTSGSKYVEEIRTALMGGAFIFTLAGFVEGAWVAHEEMKGQLFNILKVVVIASLIVGFPTIIEQGDVTLDQLHTKIAQGEQDAFRKQIEADAQEPNWADIPSRVSYSLGICLQKIGFVGYQIVYWIKDISLLLLISVSPLLIGFLAFSYTRAIGINFLITALTVILWNVGFALVDTLLVILGNVVMPLVGAGTIGVVAVTAGPQFLGLCLVAAIVPIFMYLAVPIITGALMRGTNVAGVTMSAYSMAHYAIGHSGISAGAEHLKTVAPTFPTNGNTDHVQENRNFDSGKAGLEPSSHASENAFVKNPISTTASFYGSSVPVGTTVASPDNKMVATQATGEMISVTDHVGNISTRPGNLSDGVAVDAAFNAHEATTSFLA
jgi:hypothetical protein